MADSTDIDALVVQARATARELNELLEKLEAANVGVSVIWPQRVEGYLHDSSRVELVLRFRAERVPNHTSAQRHALNPVPPGAPQRTLQEHIEAAEYMKKAGLGR